MNINLTLFGQMITFSLFVFVTMKYIWPPVMKALEDRRSKIAEGLEASERGKHELELAQKKIAEQLRETKQAAAKILDDANQRATHIVEEGKAASRKEGQRLIELAKAEIANEYQSAKASLMAEVSEIAMQGMQKVLAGGVDSNSNSQLIDKFVSELQESS